MTTQTWLSLGAALVAAVIGGVISPYLLGSRERWAARAKVLEVIRQTEHVWRHVELDHNGEPCVATGKIEAAITEIEIAAMIARPPSAVIDKYANALRSVEGSHPEEGDYGGWVLTDKAVERRLDDTRKALISCLWHPVGGTLRYAVWPSLRGVVSASRPRSSPG